jgi:hypothetical protein
VEMSHVPTASEIVTRSGVMVHTCNPSTWEAGAGVWQVSGQLG